MGGTDSPIPTTMKILHIGGLHVVHGTKNGGASVLCSLLSSHRFVHVKRLFTLHISGSPCGESLLALAYLSGRGAEPALGPAGMFRHSLQSTLAASKIVESVDTTLFARWKTVHLSGAGCIH